MNMKEIGINYSVYLNRGDFVFAYDLPAYLTTIIYNKGGKMNVFAVKYFILLE